ncbi:putative ABC transporter ATP-binding protein [Psilocybe cubensis]|uniref:ABC transporter ATP-binding protein n=2 Tax=Psilocybe cubensis TaxID=181762 RepID=A0ACB8HED2_PSICU|nr:putative ABC transporter ATP-binding protein [Psilocybe cubensis]KAH9485831.1 putative ABC transporter ATP-binding protein [Psilocybe cubensis]
MQLEKIPLIGKMFGRNNGQGVNASTDELNPTLQYPMSEVSAAGVEEVQGGESTSDSGTTLDTTENIDDKEKTQEGTSNKKRRRNKQTQARVNAIKLQEEEKRSKELAEEVERLKNERKSMQYELATLQNTVSEHSNTNRQLEIEICRLREEERNIIRDLKDAYQEIEQYKQRVSMKDSKVALLQEKLNKSISKIDELTTLLQERATEIKGVQTFLTTADLYSGADIIQMVDGLNMDIFHTAASVAEIFEQPTEADAAARLTSKDREERLEFGAERLKSIPEAIGERLYTHLANKCTELHEDPFPLQVAIQAYLAHFCTQRVQIFSGESAKSAFDDLYGRIRSAASERSIASIQTKVDAIVKQATQLKKAMHEGITTADMEVFVVRCGESFNHTVMEDSYGDNKSKKRNNKASCVLCPVGMGLRKITTNKEDRTSTTTLLFKPKVALLAVLNKEEPAHGCTEGGHTRVAPATSDIQGQWANAGGLYPFLSGASGDPYSRISYVSFRQRTGGESGAFFDYTARYGAMREEEDKITLRHTLKSSPGTGDHSLFDLLTEKMGLKSLLDLPMITLSNGQTRRARVVKAILGQPEILLLDEPLTGLDPPSRKALTETLQDLHMNRSPRIIVGVRKGEDIPPWITHILEIDGSSATAREASAVSHTFNTRTFTPAQTVNNSGHLTVKPTSLLVDMQGVNVAYGDRKVLKDINWQIRQGDRWHLQGPNGSGKTTLLALLTGDHPQSYTQRHLLLPCILPSSASSPSRSPAIGPRKRTPTAHLRRLLGVVSPEMFDAFPRRHPGMSVWEAVTTGFDGGFVPRTRDASIELRKIGSVGWVDVAEDELELDLEANEKTTHIEAVRKWRIERCWEVLKALGSASWRKDTGNNDSTNLEAATREFASHPFSSLSPGEQRLVLLMRALVGRPPVVLLDEVWSGMDDDMIAAARRYLRSNEGVSQEQAVVVITHWEDEVPWSGEEVKRFKLSSL